MKVKSHKIIAFVALVAVYFLNGCMAGKIESTSDISLDTKKIDSIKVGITNFSDILEWFGPPDFIIDGTQQIYDSENLDGAAYGSISTRTLTSPDEMVILIYVLSWTQKMTTTGVPVPVIIMNMQNKIRSDELFIYLSKKDRTVVSVVAGINAE